MVLGAIHECQRIEVYSNNGNGWLYTYVDLQEIEQGTLKGIPAPITLWCFSFPIKTYAMTWN
jgi:hypothetical protein